MRTLSFSVVTLYRRGPPTVSGKSGYRYIVSLVQHASNQAPQPPRETSSYFVLTPEQMSASVTWALRFYRVGQQGLDLGREPPSVDDENVAPIFYLNLTYSLGQHYFVRTWTRALPCKAHMPVSQLDEMFGSSTERFHAVLVELDDFLQLYTLGITPQRPTNLATTSCTYRRLSGVRLLGGACTGKCRPVLFRMCRYSELMSALTPATDPFRASLPALALDTRVIKRYMPKGSRPLTRSELILHSGVPDQDLTDSRTVVSESPCAGPASLQKADIKGQRSTATQSSATRHTFSWPTPGLLQAMVQGKNRHAMTWASNANGPCQRFLLCASLGLR